MFWQHYIRKEADTGILLGVSDLVCSLTEAPTLLGVISMASQQICGQDLDQVGCNSSTLLGVFP